MLKFDTYYAAIIAVGLLCVEYRFYCVLNWVTRWYHTLL